MSTSIKNFHGDALRLEDTKFFFIFCPNNSGTTVMSQYLTAQIDGFLPPFGHNEGQMMPEVRDMMRAAPWDAETAFDWAFIRSQWETLVSGKPFVEASPPNILRPGQIEAVFGHDSTALISICDPYQHIASSMRRYSFSPINVAKEWIQKARAVRQIRKSYPHFPLVTYEDFVANPGIVNEKIGVPVRDAVVEGKTGSGIEGIASSYVRTVAFLQEKDVQDATSVLEGVPRLLKYFGYRLAGPEFLIQARKQDAREFEVGLARREAWNRRQAAAK